MLDWAAPANVTAVFSTRSAGVSVPPYNGMNVATHVGDHPLCVQQNRQQLSVLAKLPAEPAWLNQIHGTEVLCLDAATQGLPDADGACTTRANVVLAVMVADCLPIFLCDELGDQVALLHAGWRGLAAGIVTKGVQQFQSTRLIAHIGPGIGPCHFEVDKLVKHQFPDYDWAFVQGRDNQHWQMNLAAVAQAQLHQAGVTTVTASQQCTWCETGKYFSARRDGAASGRNVALIWRT